MEVDVVDEEFLDVTDDGGVAKKVLKEGEGECPKTDGSIRVKCIIRMWYLDPVKRSKRVVYEPTEAMPELKWMLKNPFDKPMEDPPKGAEACVVSMRKGEKSVFRVRPKYAYGADGGSVASTKPLKRVPGNTTVYFEIELLRMRPPTLKRFQYNNVIRVKLARECKEKGVELYKAGKYQEAIMQFRDGSDYSSCVTPTENREFVYTVRVPVCLNAAVCCMKLEKWKEAFDHANDALKMDYDNIKGLYLRAQSLGKLDRWEEAMTTIVKAVKLDPTNRKVRETYELVKKKLGPRSDTTKETFDKVFVKHIYDDETGTAWGTGTGIFAEIVYGFLLWSLFATLGAQIWFFPLEYMDVTGFEVIVLCIFAPIILGLSARLRVFAQHQVLHFVAAMGLAFAFKTKLLLPRTIVLGASTALSLVCTTARFSHTGKWLGLSGAAFGLDRLWGYSRSSVWTHNGTVAILLFMVGSAVYLGHPAREREPKYGFSLPVAVSLGSLMYAINWFVLQPGVWSRCVDFPVMPLAAWVCLACIVGFAAPFPRSVRAQRALAAAPLLLSLWIVASPSQIAIVLFMTTVSMLWKPTALQAGGRPHASTLFAAIVVWFFHFLASIWIVAYNFVPFGGALMREHSYSHLVVLAVLVGLAAALKPIVPGKKPEPWYARRQYLVVGFLLLLVFVPVAFIRLKDHLQVPYHAARQARTDNGQIRSMIWAVHFGYDNFGRSSLESIEEVIRSNNVNVIGLLESDLSRPFTDNWDVVDHLATRLGLHSDFGPSTFNNTWGCALLSVYPIVHAERWMLPSPEGELACILDATLDVRGKRVHVIVTHFGNHRDVIDRQLQTDEVAALLRRAPKASPHLFLGYLTNRPYSPHYNQFTEAGWIDSAPDVLNRWCQYIFYRGLKLQKFARYDTGDISDTEAQIGFFTVDG